MSPTGASIRLEGQIENRRFYRKSSGKNPEGALLSFTRDGKNFEAYTDQTDVTFKGYKTKSKEKAGFPKLSISNLNKIEIIAGIHYNTEECSNKIYTFSFESSDLFTVVYVR
ncbi:MAG: hypothetical protein IPL46_25185 [Saprospiraceae bacterium]|nr:hypothetical protein [Saprospiraceae bacterium]